MNLPNRLTLLRLFLVPVFMIFTITDNVYTRILALVIFIGAGITDLYDGYLARKYNIVTSLGAFLDPLADKMITIAAFISFVQLVEINIPAWMVVLIVGRDFIITGLRSLAALKGKVIPADETGKFKTSIQVTAIITTLTVLIVNSIWNHYWDISSSLLIRDPGWRHIAGWMFRGIPYWIMFLTTIFTLISGLSYLRKNIYLLKET